MRHVLRRTAWVLALALAAETAVVSLTTGQAFASSTTTTTTTTTTRAKTAKPTATSADTESAALLMARMTNRKIEVLSARTESTTTYALPNGQLQTTVHAAPVRVERDGTWRDIDTSLTDTGAALEPGTAVADIEISDGGDRELASVTKGGKSFGLGWAEKLPEPKAKGDTASYDLGDGETLTVTALSQGFSQYVILAKAPDSAPVYRIPVHLDGLKLSEAPSGHLLLKDGSGKLVAEAPAPMMWDASVDKRSGESKHLAPVDTEIETGKDGSQTLVLTPDPAYFEQDLTYPVTVDPTSTLAVTTDTWVATNYPDSQVSSTELKSGTYDAGTTKARSYLKFDVSAFKGKHITDTNLALYSYWSSTCSTAGAGTQVRRITSSWSSSTVTWGDQPSTTTTGAVTNTAAMGYSDACPAGTMNFDIDAIVQAWAGGATNHGIQVRGASETDSMTWRRFRSANYVSGNGSTEPHLTVTYNSYPATPASRAISPSAVNAYNGKRYVTSLRPTLSATVTDADGSTARAQFEITEDPAYADADGFSYTKSTSYVASGQTASLKIPEGSELPAGKHLRYRVRAYDGTDYGAWTGYTTFVMNTAKPAAPTIACDTYGQDTWTAKAADAVTCTLDTSSSDGAGYHWGLDDADVPNKKLDTTNGTGGDELTIGIDPADGWHTLYARTVDSGGNLSTATTAYRFGVGADGAAITAPADGADTARRLTLAARGQSSYTGVTWQYRRGETDAWHTVPAGDTTADAWPAAVTDGVADKLVWNVTDTLDEDGALDLRAAFTGGTATGYSQTVTVTLDRDAGNAPTSTVGPGTVNLLTGDYTITETDADAFSASVTRTTSSRARDAESEGQAQIFGPGWVSSVVADTTGGDYLQVRRTSGTSVEVLGADGSSVAFTATSDGGWQPETGAESLTLTGTLSGDTFTLTDTEADTSVFTKAGTDATTWTLSSAKAAVDNSTVTVVSETVTEDGKALARPTYVITPTGAVPAAACRATPSTAGCRMLEFVYATSTTATGYSTAADFGDYTGRVKAIRQWSTEPGASSATSRAVATYRYDAAGRLRQQWNPNLSQATQTQYSYDSANRVFWYHAKNELAWNFDYGRAGSAAGAGEGMLLSASRPALKQGSDTETDGTAATTVVYDVPLSGGAAPYRMDADTVATWGQDTAPADATAVFPADRVPASSTGADLAADAYGRATVTYIGAGGEETNTASPGGGITTTKYDDAGNTVRELTAANRELALGSSDTLAELGIDGLSTAERAERLSSTTVYSADGTRVTDEYGPLALVTLASGLAGTSTEATLPAGTVVPARQHTSYAYDEDRPSTAAVSDQVTSTTVGAAVEGYPADADTRTTATGYDWATGLETSFTEDPGGLGITTRTAYDEAGRVVRERRAASDGSDAGTMTTTYYTASGTGTCAGRPEWEGLVCRTAPAGTVSGDNPSELVTTVYTYDWWGQPATRTETANGTTRTTTMTVDDAGRVTSTAVTGGTGQETPATTYTYTANGRVATIASGGRTITYGYDKLGRVTSYDDGAGNTTTTAYDILDRVVRTADSAPSSATFGYDSADRVSTLTDSVAGTFTATYDVDGTLLTETLPGDRTLTVSTDPAGNRTSREYTQSDGTTLLSDTAAYTVHGQRAGHTQTDGTSTTSDYGYDATGRLTTATDNNDTSCVTRAYTFDRNDNRTGLTTTSDDCDSATDDATSSTVSYTYDAADRLTGDGRSYDAFGRTTTNGDTELSYYTNDLVRSETLGGRRQTWTLDAAGRLASVRAETLTDGTWATTKTRTSHYGDDGDTPAWAVDGNGAVTREVRDLTGQLTATTSANGDVVLQLTNLHGDVAVQLPADTSAAATVQRFDEYGNRLAETAAVTYGWTGGYQRSSATVSGLTLMGIRLYDATTGRFLQTDPIADGSPSAYAYPSDPVNGYDLDGRKWKKMKEWKVKKKKAKKLAKALKAGARLVSSFGRIGITIPTFWSRVIGLALEGIGGGLRWLATEIQVKNAMPKSKGVKIRAGIWQNDRWSWIVYPRIQVKRWKK
ncbi:DNRLRE domain-containing protein [Streptomyces sp. NPDC002845]